MLLQNHPLCCLLYLHLEGQTASVHSPISPNVLVFSDYQRDYLNTLPFIGKTAFEVEKVLEIKYWPGPIIHASMQKRKKDKNMYLIRCPTKICVLVIKLCNKQLRWHWGFGMLWWAELWWQHEERFDALLKSDDKNPLRGRFFIGGFHYKTWE